MPERRIRYGLLGAIPLFMLVLMAFRIGNPFAQVDALDALAYLFGPLWPTLGAILGYALGRTVHDYVGRK